MNQKRQKKSQITDQKTITREQFERSLISQQKVLLEGGAYEVRDLQVLSVVLHAMDQLALQALSPFIEKKASVFQRQLLELIVNQAYQRIKAFSYWMEKHDGDLVYLAVLEMKDDLPELRLNLLKSQLETVYQALQENQSLPDSLYQVLIQAILFFKEVANKLRLVNVSKKEVLSGVERVWCYHVLRFALEHIKELYSYSYGAEL